MRDDRESRDEPASQCSAQPTITRHGDDPNAPGAEMSETRLATGVSAIYFMYLAGVGLAVTFWPFHLQALGFSGAMIGRIFMVRTGMNIVAQPAIARLGDVTGRPLTIIRIALVWGAIAPLGMLVFSNWWLVAASVWIGGLMTSSLVPLLDSTIVTRLPHRPYGSIRMWGSLGYGLIVCGFGFATENVAHATAGRWSLYAWTTVMLLGAFVGLGLRDERAKPSLRRAESRSRRRFFKRGNGSTAKRKAWYSLPLLTLFALNTCHWFGVMSFNIYFGLHTEWRGFSPLVPALGILCAISAEAVVLRRARAVLIPNTAIRLLPLVYAVTALRWLLTAIVPTAEWLILIQLLHGVTFGLWMSAMITVIGRFVAPEHRSAAQGLMGGIVFGVGGMAGSVTSGYLFDAGGGSLIFYGCAAVECVTLALFLGWWCFSGREHFARE